MMGELDVFLSILTLVALSAATVTDFKKREVPDWISYGLIAAALGTRLLYSIFNSNFKFFLTGLFGFLVLLVVANILYYLGQWGGGDAKLFMGMGAVLGFSLPLALFVLLLVFSGAVYGMIYSVYLSIKNKKSFRRAYHENIKMFKYLSVFALAFLLIGIFSFFFISDFSLAFLLFAVSVISYMGIFSFIFVKSVEESCLYKKLKATQLTEGDWIAQDIMIKGKLIVPEKNIGITKQQLKLVRGYKKPILVKLGVPFIPAFLIAFIAFIFLKNAILSLL
jgi:Flp pilus assembly protein protease CpaA